MNQETMEGMPDRLPEFSISGTFMPSQSDWENIGPVEVDDELVVTVRVVARRVGLKHEPGEEAEPRPFASLQVDKTSTVKVRR